jgi:YceI-like domain
MKTIPLILLIIISLSAQGQKFAAATSLVSFYSHAPMEDIQAKNTKSQSIYNRATEEIVFVIPMKDFVFEKSLMQEHFNEKYLDTEKYPKATFQGKISGYNPTVSAVQGAKATGKLTIHGVARDIELPGTIESIGDQLILKSTFVITIADYDITRPQLLWQNIAEHVEVKIEFTYKPL